MGMRRASAPNPAIPTSLSKPPNLDNPGASSQSLGPKLPPNLGSTLLYMTGNTQDIEKAKERVQLSINAQVSCHVPFLLRHTSKARFVIHLRFLSAAL
jgi:hypothetical protein